MEKSVFKADSRRILVTIVSSNLFATLSVFDDNENGFFSK
jgi:hypothetical protein